MKQHWPKRTGRSTRNHTGHVLVEYLLVTSVLALALLSGDPSPAEQCLRAFRTAYAKYTYSISLP